MKGQRYYTDAGVMSLDADMDDADDGACECSNWTLGMRRSRNMPEPDRPEPDIEEGLAFRERMAPGYND